MDTDRNQPPTVANYSRRHLIAEGGIAVAFALLGGSQPAFAESDGISRSAESIHQETRFTANRKRIYEALTESKRFDRVVQLSGVMQSAALAPMKNPTEISQQAGGAFSAFGGYIMGRQIELIPDMLIVQAWRAGSWDSGVYSIARFALVKQGTETTIKFDHTGFPLGQADHLAAGWKANYWEPLAKYLAEA
jgi:activator of HSP90 ATPase